VKNSARRWMSQMYVLSICLLGVIDDFGISKLVWWHFLNISAYCVRLKNPPSSWKFFQELKLFSLWYCTVHNNLFVFLSQSKQEAVLFEVQFLINETKNTLFNLHEWTKPEKVRLNSPVCYKSIFHKFCVSTHDCSISSLQKALSMWWMMF
jgi:hypothetical protein